VKRLWLIGIGFLVVFGGFLVVLSRPHRDLWKPLCLSGAAICPVQDEKLEAAPFRRLISPKRYQSLGKEGVQWQDYLVEGDFKSVESLVGGELAQKAGWEYLYTAPWNPHKNSALAGEMNALFIRGEQAVTVFRAPFDKKVRVRVWSRTPTLFSKLF
jgi:hypothetical protein